MWLWSVLRSRHPVHRALVLTWAACIGICFGWLWAFTPLPLWASALLALPAGTAFFVLAVWMTGN